MSIVSGKLLRMCNVLFTQSKTQLQNQYINGNYIKNNPTWHIEDSFWKAKQILKIMKKNNINPKTICEIGCGGGEILRQLQLNLSTDCEFFGTEISAKAFELCKTRANDKLHFELKDILKDDIPYYDLILLIDVIEHIENYFEFLRKIKLKSKYKILHIPLDISVQSILRQTPIIEGRKLVGHIHYFTKEIALEILKDVGFTVIDLFYTASSIERPIKSIKSWMARLPRKILFKINKDLCVRILGGYSLIVLIK